MPATPGEELRYIFGHHPPPFQTSLRGPAMPFTKMSRNLPKFYLTNQAQNGKLNCL
jgi:hypothetical protein